MKQPTGVVVKVKVVKDSAKELINYVLDLMRKKKSQSAAVADQLPGKLLCPPLLSHLPDGERPERHFKRLSKRRRKGLNVALALTISRGPGLVWSPPQWEYFWNRFALHLSKTAKTFNAKKNPVRVDLRSQPAILPIHDNTDNQHLQGLVSLVSEEHDNVVVINDGWIYIAVQWAAREAERDLGLTAHPNMPDYKVSIEYCARVTDPRYEGQTRPRKRPADGKWKRAGKAREMRGASKVAVEKVRELLRGRLPEAFNTLDELETELASANACVKRHNRGLVFAIDGEHTKASDVDTRWSWKYFKTWFQLPPEWKMAGTALNKQLNSTLENLLPAMPAETLEYLPPRNDLEELALHALKPVARLHWWNLELDLVERDGSIKPQGEISVETCIDLFQQWFAPWLYRRGKVVPNPREKDFLATVILRPALPENVLALTLHRLSESQLQRYQRDYKVSAGVQTSPTEYSALIQFKTMPACERWQNRNARTRLAQKLRERYQAQIGHAPGSGIPAPGLPQFGDTGFLTKLIGDPQYEVCPRATRELQECWRELEIEEKRWWRGVGGEVVERLDRLPSLTPGLAEYRNAVEAIAASSIRVRGADDLTIRVAGRLLQSGLTEDRVKAVISEGTAAMELHLKTDWIRPVERAVHRLTWSKPMPRQEWGPLPTLPPKKSRAVPAPPSEAKPQAMAAEMVAPAKQKKSGRKKRHESAPAKPLEKKVNFAAMAPPDPTPPWSSQQSKQPHGRRLAALAGLYRFLHHATRSEKHLRKYAELMAVVVQENECDEQTVDHFAQIWAGLEKEKLPELRRWLLDDGAKEPEWTAAKEIQAADPSPTRTR